MTDAEEPKRRLQAALLVMRAAKRDEQAFTQLIDLFDRRLLYFVRRMIPDPNSVLDIVQETWIYVYRSLPQLREPQAFQSWMFRIARGFIVKHHRTTGVLAQIAWDADVVDDHAEEERFTAEQAAGVHLALGRLSMAHREILLLRFLEDFSMEEIAATLDIAVGSAKSRLHHAKLALKRILEQQGATS